MIDTLNNKPVIGVVSGIGSGIMYYIKVALTDDVVLKAVASAGVYIGIIVACMSFYAKRLEIKKQNLEIKKLEEKS
jgi:hypothetical protein